MPKDLTEYKENSRVKKIIQYQSIIVFVTREMEMQYNLQHTIDLSGENVHTIYNPSFKMTKTTIKSKYIFIEFFS